MITNVKCPDCKGYRFSEPTLDKHTFKPCIVCLICKKKLVFEATE